MRLFFVLIKVMLLLNIPCLSKTIRYLHLDISCVYHHPYFKDIHIVDIFSIGREELRDNDLFLQSWIDLLMHQSGEVAARLLREGLLYYKGTEGLLEMARQGYKEHPSVYLSVLLEYEKDHDYGKMKEIAKEALDRIERDLKIRGKIAIKAAQAAHCINDSELVLIQNLFDGPVQLALHIVHTDNDSHNLFVCYSSSYVILQTFILAATELTSTVLSSLLLIQKLLSSF